MAAFGRFFGPRMLAGITVVGSLALAAPAWASSVAGSPASDGSAASNAAPSAPHGVMSPGGGACGCQVGAAGARTGAPAGAAGREGHMQARTSTPHAPQTAGVSHSGGSQRFARSLRTR